MKFVTRNNLIGVAVAQLFWGQLHIKYLVVEEKHRGQGYARKLMESVFEYGKQQDCQFVFVETMNFQAPEFYQKLGFSMEKLPNALNFYFKTLSIPVYPKLSSRKQKKIIKTFRNLLK